jgi:hypothetical protein
LAVVAVGSMVVLGGCGGPDGDTAGSGHAPGDAAVSLSDLRDPAVPALPFDDNPDPDQCGIPTRWGLDDPAWLTGMWEGELIEPDVLLYDSHQRLRIEGSIPHGGEVRIILVQENPVLDFYLVEAADGSAEGWVPAPFVSFEPVG